MSMNPPPAEPESGVPPPARRGMGCGAKVLLTLGALFGAILLLCCGVGGFFYYHLTHAFTSDPAAIAQITAQMDKINLPPQFKPVSAAENLNIYYASFRLALYAEKPEGNTITLVVAKDKGNVPQEQLESQLRQMANLIATQAGLAKQLNVEDRHQRQLTVRGKPVSFTFSTGKDLQSGKPWREVHGTFQGDQGMTLFMFSGDSAKYSEDQVAKIIESIH
jgi:hypothetical protein